MKPKTENTVKQETKTVEVKNEYACTINFIHRVKQEEAPIVEEKKEDNTPKQVLKRLPIQNSYSP